MNNQQIKVAKAILSTSDIILHRIGMAAFAFEALEGHYVLAFFKGDELTISDSLSQTGHADCITFPAFSEEAVWQWANLYEDESVEMEGIISDYVWEVYVPEQRRRLEAMLEAATA